MPGITNNSGFTRALQRMDEINAAKRLIENAFYRAEQAKSCDWAPVGEIKNPLAKKTDIVPYFNDWQMIGKVESPAEPKYFSPFAPIE